MTRYLVDRRDDKEFVDGLPICKYMNLVEFRRGESSKSENKTVDACKRALSRIRLLREPRAVQAET